MPLMIGLVFLLLNAKVEANDGDQAKVEVEEIVVGQPTTAEKAEELWNKTKSVTGDVVDSAATFTKEKSNQAWDASKKGVAKGADVVVVQSKKTWDSTKEVSAKVVDYSATKAAQVGSVIKNVLDSDDQEVPVTDKSVNGD